MENLFNIVNTINKYLLREFTTVDISEEKIKRETEERIMTLQKEYFKTKEETEELRILLLLYASLAGVQCLIANPTEEAIEYQMAESLCYTFLWEYIPPLKIFLHYIEIHKKQNRWWYEGELISIFEIMEHEEAEERIWFRESRSRKAIQKWVAEKRHAWFEEQKLKPDKWFRREERIPRADIGEWKFLSTWADYKQAAEAMNNCLFSHYWGDYLPDKIFYHERLKIAVSLDTAEERRGYNNAPLDTAQMEAVSLLKEKIESLGVNWSEVQYAEE